MAEFSILVVDDDQSLRRVVEFNLKKHSYNVTAVDNGAMALDIIGRRHFDLLISDIKMEGMDGVELMRAVHEFKPDLPVILITAYGTIEKAVEAIKTGAFDYVTKPFDMDDFMHTVDKALEFRRLVNENLRLKKELNSKYSFDNIIGVSQPMQDVFSIIKKTADTDTTVLISGESGTGKELVARAIHQNSSRSEKPMITVNCAAIPHDLLESELFGHTAGAFTGAVKDKTGKFVLADGGTIFLDEIGDMKLELQAKLLRVLEDRKVEPVGATEMIEVDIRVIAATNHELRKKIEDNRFREDLFYRLNVIPVHIPPLRDRKDDVPLLVKSFLKEYSPDGRGSIDSSAMNILTDYDWPGNVRELKNLIKRIVVLSDGNIIRISDIPSEIKSPRRQSDDSGNGDAGPPKTLRENEKQLILDALERAGGNQSKAAKMLDIPRHVLIYRMKKHRIS